MTTTNEMKAVTTPFWKSVIPPETAFAMTFEQLAMLECGTTVWYEELPSGGAFMVMRGFACLCAYLGVPRDHPAAGVHYDEILAAADREIAVHYGLTFSDYGDGEWRSASYYWLGWDYGHCTDRTFRDLMPDLIAIRRNLGHPLRREEEREWLLPDVIKDSRPTVEIFDRAISEWSNGHTIKDGSETSKRHE